MASISSNIVHSSSVHVYHILPSAKIESKEDSEAEEEKGNDIHLGEFINKKEVHLQEENNNHNSLINEDSTSIDVNKIIPPVDDSSLSENTFRAWFIGILLTIIITFVNTIFMYRTSPLSIRLIVIQLIAFPLGKAMAKWIPQGRFNRGPFNIKENVLICMMVTSGGITYAVEIIVVQKVFYKQDFGFLFALLLIMSTQLIGYGMAGMARKQLVWPAAMPWPSTFSTISLFKTLHSSEQDQSPYKMSRYSFFIWIFGLSFIYYWFPGYLFEVLTSISWLCWINRSDIHLAQLGSGKRGLGFGAFSLDWNTIVSFLGSPLLSPTWAIYNMLIGFIIAYWMVLPIAYYSNVWNSKNMPIANSGLFTVDGDNYPYMSILNPDLQSINESAYEKVGPLRLSLGYAFKNTFSFAAITSILVHTYLYYNREIKERFLSTFNSKEFNDPHALLMKQYPEVPNWWYLLLFLFSIIAGIITVEAWPTGLPWWGLILGTAICAIFILPVGIVMAITNQTPFLIAVSELIAGFIWPARPITNMLFKTYGAISTFQAVHFLSDLKLGHYMKIPPKSMFLAQIIGTIVANIVNLACTYWLLDTIPDFCTTKSTDFSCPDIQIFFSASIIWGAIGPGMMFGASSLYNPLLYGFLIGALLPFPFYYLGKKYHNSIWKYIHIPLVCQTLALFIPTPALVYVPWSLIGILFTSYIRTRYSKWFFKYNYVLSAGLDSGVAIAGLLIFFSLQLPEKYISWWGSNQNDSSQEQCPLGAANFYGKIP